MYIHAYAYKYIALYCLGPNRPENAFELEYLAQPLLLIMCASSFLHSFQFAILFFLMFMI